MKEGRDKYENIYSRDEFSAMFGVLEDYNFYPRELVCVTGNENYLLQVVQQAIDSENRHDSEIAAIESISHGPQFEFAGKKWVDINPVYPGRVATKICYRIKNNKWIEKKSIRVSEQHREQIVREVSEYPLICTQYVFEEA